MSIQFKKCAKGIWLVNHESGLIYSPPCGLKECPECAEKMRKSSVHRILKQVSDTSLTHKWWFWTITPNKTSIWNETTVKSLQRGWERLRKRLHRRWHGEIFWVLAKEYTKGAGIYKRGKIPPPPFVHAHIMIGHPIGEDEIYTRELKDICHAVGLGYMALVGVKGARDKPITGKKEAFYMGKYLSKADDEKKISRTSAYSRNFKMLRTATRATSKWELLRVTDGDIEDFAEDHNYKVRNRINDKPQEAI
jgi:hypothetical protein